MKALTLTQPWASLVAVGAKTVETRSWSTPYRGALAIHAAKGWTEDDRDLCYEEPFLTALKAAKVDSYAQLPRGCVLATCRLVTCMRTERIVGSLSDEEVIFGNYAPGRWAWVLEDIVRLPKPICMRGALGLWSISAEMFGVPEVATS